MRAILIDPATESVSEVEYNGDYKEIHKLIDCHTFDVVRIDDKGNTLFIDDEGLYSSMDSGEFEPFFHWEGYPQPLAGKGLVLGTNMEGDSVATDLSLDEAKAKVSFELLRCVDIKTVEGETERYGKKMKYIQSVPVFERQR